VKSKQIPVFLTTGKVMHQNFCKLKIFEKKEEFLVSAKKSFGILKPLTETLTFNQHNY